jgi:hypothetical protein
MLLATGGWQFTIPRAVKPVLDRKFHPRRHPQLDLTVALCPGSESDDDDDGEVASDDDDEEEEEDSHGACVAVLMMDPNPKMYS